MVQYTGVPAAQLVGRRSWRRGQTAGGGSIPRWSTGIFFSVQRLHGFRQVVQQVCTCRKLIDKLPCMSVQIDMITKEGNSDLYIVQ